MERSSFLHPGKAPNTSRWHPAAWLTGSRRSGDSSMLDPVQSFVQPLRSLPPIQTLQLGQSGVGPVHQSPPTQAQLHFHCSGTSLPSIASIPSFLHCKFDYDHVSLLLPTFTNASILRISSRLPTLYYIATACISSHISPIYPIQIKSLHKCTCLYLCPRSSSN